MKTMLLALAAALIAESAFAHPSVVPHEHPHAASFLPDAFALMLAALVVAIGFAAFRRIGKE